MLVTIDATILIILFVVAALIIGGSVMFVMTLYKRAPEAVLFMLARQRKIPIVIMHYPNNVARMFLPTLEKGTEGIANYYSVDNGNFKFIDASGQNFEKLSGDITVYHVMQNVTESINVRVASHLSTLSRFLSQRGMAIDGMEDLFFYVITQCLRDDDNDGRLPTVDEVLERLRINDEATRLKLRVVVGYVIKHQKEIEKLVPLLRPQPFNFQTIIRSWDNLMAFTSKNFIQAKSIIETKAKRDVNSGNKEIFIYVIAAVIVICGTAFALKVLGLF